MKKLENILVIGSSDTAPKINALFSDAGLPSTLKDSLRENLNGIDIIIESLPYGEADRQADFREWGDRAAPDTILATTTTMGITEIASVTKNPERVIGLNFTFNPFDEKCLVQIVKGLATSEESIAACRELQAKTGAAAVTVEDAPALLLDRVIAQMVNEAATMYTTGVASKEDIDRITTLCLNWPMGPFEFADYVGIDNVLSTLEILSRQESPRFLPCRLLREMVAMNKLGKKTGAGFYTYR